MPIRARQARAESQIFKLIFEFRVLVIPERAGWAKLIGRGGHGTVGRGTVTYAAELRGRKYTIFVRRSVCRHG